MKRFFLLIIALIGISLLYSDEIELLNSYWDFYSENNGDYYSMGLGLATSADIGSAYTAQINPASFDIKYHSIYAAMEFKTKFILLDTLVISAKQPIINFGYARSIKKLFNVGFYYESTKNFKIYNKGDSDTPYLSDKDLFFKETGYALAFNFVGNRRIRLGTTLYLKSYVLNEETANSFIDRFRKWGFGAKIGGVFIPIKNLNIGLTYSFPMKRNIRVLASDDETYFSAKKVYPQELSASLKYQILKYSFYYSFDYKNTSADFYNLQDRLNHHTGIKYCLNNYIDLLGGFFTKFSYYGNESYDEIPDLPPIENEYFVTGGINLKADDLSFGISFMDSHITGAIVPKTYLSFGFSYDGETLF